MLICTVIGHCLIYRSHLYSLEKITKKIYPKVRDTNIIAFSSCRKEIAVNHVITRPGKQQMWLCNWLPGSHICRSWHWTGTWHRFIYKNFDRNRVSNQMEFEWKQGCVVYTKYGFEISVMCNCYDKLFIWQWSSKKIWIRHLLVS